MYLSADAVIEAISILRSQVHPFVGITFIACKHYGLSVGSEDDVSIDGLTRDHMDSHHRIDRRSAHYFQPFKGIRSWVASKYPSTGLQTVNTQTFGPVFLHRRNEQKWGFTPDYSDRIESTLRKMNLPPPVAADALAVWLFKDADLGTISTYEDLVQHFFTEYKINEIESSRLFSKRSMPALVSAENAFVSTPLEMTAVLRALPEPPDAQAEGGRTITSLRLTNTGPAREVKMDFGQRLTIVTGDNGLGKSFLLDFAWWAATGLWADRMAMPQRGDQRAAPEAEYTISGNSGRTATFTATFDQKNFSWIRPRNAMTVEALAVFSRADGSFAVADPIRSKFNQTSIAGSLTALDVWNGRQGFMEGLIRDWIRWQSAIDRKVFDQFTSILRRLSPDDLGPLTPGDPVRLPGDPREIPTIKHRYATVPVTHASSGVQRVLLLAYLIIWSWQEHEIAAQQLSRSPLRRMMVIVDELEAHLHPKWQRIVLPALMGVGDLLSSDLALQMITATHSPMILASMESVFDPATDLLYHLYGAGSEVRLEETPFVKYGDASGWLTSPLFGLQHARSRDAERAIEDAKALQLQSNPEPEKVMAVSNRLKLHLASDDKFWPRWLFFAEEHGVEI
ncbi:AAA family ATPase [Reyranella sp.]|uniref:AAA family ATPase n=1 Tax=Reyranella sp. TaxID=1929291 RepID=UPI003F70E928